MNRREIDEMRRRLAARTITEGEDHPLALAAATLLFLAVFFLAFFI
jgi:hypothetical protein